MRNRLNIRSLRQERGEKQKAIEAIEATAKAANREISDDEMKAVESHLSDIEKIDADIERAEKVLEIRSKGAQPVDPQEDLEEAPRSPARVEPNIPKGMVMTECIRAIAYSSVLRSSGNAMSAADIARKIYRNEVVAKALSEGTNSAGGFLVPQNFSQEYIDLLRNATVLRQAGVRMVSLPNGNMKMPKGLTGSSAAYVGENATIAASQGTFGQLAFAAKKLAALIPVSNELLADSSPSAAAILRDDLVLSASLAEDAAMLRSDGSGNSPTGILNQVNAAHKFAATNATAPTLAQVKADLAKAVSLLATANIPMTGLFWVMAPRVRYFLEGMTDGNGNYGFPSLQGENPTLLGFPVKMTGQVPINLGAGTNESEIYLCAGPQLVIADTSLVELAVSAEATYDSGGGTLVSAFANDQTVMRVISRHDFKMRYDKAAVILTVVKWGG